MLSNSIVCHILSNIKQNKFYLNANPRSNNIKFRIICIRIPSPKEGLNE